MSDPSYPDRDDIIAQVQAACVPGGGPISLYLALDARNTLPPADAAALLDTVLVSLEGRLRHAENVTGIV
jgi:hypothetical protein